MSIAIIGAGPAGLMAAEILSGAGLPVTVYDRMPSPARKFLMAGRGGLNLTHSEPFAPFLARYGDAAPLLRPYLEAFPPAALIAWAEGLGEPTFTGSSGRIFPKSLKASPLLRAWLARLDRQGVILRNRHDWRGWDESGALIFAHEGETLRVRPDATLLALGGASWPRLGSDGAWADLLTAKGVEVRPFRPANCGFEIAWSDHFQKFAGTPLKGIAISHGDKTVRGEAMITDMGIEGGAIYALSAALRNAITKNGSAEIQIDLRPDLSPAALAARLARPRGRESLSNHLRKSLSLSPVAIGLMREAFGRDLDAGPGGIASAVKSLPLRLTATAGLMRAISSAGGIAFEALEKNLMLKALPGVYAAGEMIDWEAPTGGYLLQAIFATAAAAAEAILKQVSR